MSKLKPALVLALALVACRGGESGDDDDGGDAGGGGDEVTIYDVQSEDMDVGTPVTLRGVVVTAIDTYGGRTGAFYVQEPDGGPFSGVMVFATGTTAAELEVGDLVDIENAVKDEFALGDDETGKKLTELKGPDTGSLVVTQVGSGGAIEPEVLQPWELAASDDEAEKWEGVLVRFEGVRVFFEPEGVGSDETLTEMTVTGPFRVSSSLASLGDGVEQGTCFASITGIGDYFFNYKILPRSSADLVVGADGDCLPAEATQELCEDSEIDNDYNGFANCADFGCQVAVDSCVAETTVAAIQSGEHDDNARVHVLRAVVIGKTENKKRFWVQDEDASAPGAGIFAFRPGSADDLAEDVVPGAVVEIVGNVDQDDCNGACPDNPLTRLTNVQVTVLESGAAPTPLSATPAQAVSEQYEGSYVTVADVKVVDPDLEYSQFSVTDGTTTFVVDDDIFRYESAVADQCVSISGIMHMNIFDNSTADPPGMTPHVVLLPLSEASIASSNGCD